MAGRRACSGRPMHACREHCAHHVVRWSPLPALYARPSAAVPHSPRCWPAMAALGGSCRALRAPSAARCTALLLLACAWACPAAAWPLPLSLDASPAAEPAPEALPEAAASAQLLVSAFQGPANNQGACPCPDSPPSGGGTCQQQRDAGNWCGAVGAVGGRRRSPPDRRQPLADER